MQNTNSQLSSTSNFNSDISSGPLFEPLDLKYPLIDTHTHFDAPVFDADRLSQAKQAYDCGVRHLVLVGYLYRHFERLCDTQQALNLAMTTTASTTATEKYQVSLVPQVNIALGLHPFYIEQHTEAHLVALAKMIAEQRPIAIGEIGLDTFTPAMKQPANFAKQQRFFIAQLDMAVSYQLPVMLHIRKAHADALAILKAHTYDAHELGGIAHSFSGGEQEAKAFVKLGFKLGVTGQITNPNAKKLRRTIQAVVAEFGIECLVLETDCPDMTPISCQTAEVDWSPSASLAPPSSTSGQSPTDKNQLSETHNRNVPANLPWVLKGLSELLEIEMKVLASQLWQNSGDSLRTDWPYPLLEAVQY